MNSSLIRLSTSGLRSWLGANYAQFMEHTVYTMSEDSHSLGSLELRNYEAHCMDASANFESEKEQFFQPGWSAKSDCL